MRNSTRSVSLHGSSAEHRSRPPVEKQANGFVVAAESSEVLRNAGAAGHLRVRKQAPHDAAASRCEGNAPLGACGLCLRGFLPLDQSPGGSECNTVYMYVFIFAVPQSDFNGVFRILAQSGIPIRLQLLATLCTCRDSAGAARLRFTLLLSS